MNTRAVVTKVMAYLRIILGTKLFGGLVLTVLGSGCSTPAHCELRGSSVTVCRDQDAWSCTGIPGCQLEPHCIPAGCDPNVDHDAGEAGLCAEELETVCSPLPESSCASRHQTSKNLCDRMSPRDCFPTFDCEWGPKCGGSATVDCAAYKDVPSCMDMPACIWRDQSGIGG